MNDDGLGYCMGLYLQHKFWNCIFTKQRHSQVLTLFLKGSPSFLLLLMKLSLHYEKKKTAVFLSVILFNVWHVLLTWWINMLFHVTIILTLSGYPVITQILLCWKHYCTINTMRVMRFSSHPQFSLYISASDSSIVTKWLQNH